MSYYCYLICDFASCLLVPQKSFNALESDEPACVAFHVLNEGPNVFIHKNYVFNNGSFRIEGKRMAWGGVEHTNRLPFLLGAIRNSGLFPPPIRNGCISSNDCVVFCRFRSFEGSPTFYEGHHLFLRELDGLFDHWYDITMSPDICCKFHRINWDVVNEFQGRSFAVCRVWPGFVTPQRDIVGWLGFFEYMYKGENIGWNALSSVRCDSRSWLSSWSDFCGKVRSLSTLEPFFFKLKSCLDQGKLPGVIVGGAAFRGAAFQIPLTNASFVP